MNQTNDPDSIVRASLTLTFGFPKLAFFFPENAQYVGEWKVLDIGIHPDIVDNTSTPYMMVTEDDISEVFQPRDKFSHKGTFGHALLMPEAKERWEPPCLPPVHA